MAGDVQRVEPGALTSQASEMKGQNWHAPSEVTVTPPDALPATKDAVANLNDNAQSLTQFEQWAEVENHRIAEMLEIASAAYQKVDDDYGRAIEDPDRAAAVDAITIPDPATPPPQLPGPVGTLRLLDASGYSNVTQTQADLTAPDSGASLKTAMLQWGVASKRIENNKPKPPPGNWEGDAADAAYARMTAFGSWLTQLSEAWYDLAKAAAKIVAAHDKAKSTHDPIHQEYVALEQRIMALASVTGPHGGVRVQNEIEKIRERMQELQSQSDEVRQDYASSATFAPVQPAEPPFKGNGGPTTVGGGGGGPSGDAAAMAQKMAESLGVPTPASTPAAQSQPQPGAGQSGGSPAGGGSPSGGGTPGDSPGGSPGGSPAGLPKTPTDPSVRPAAGGGGAGRGAGGGAGGAGMGSTPLSPAVTAETVAPGPPVPVGAGPAPATAGGAAGGAMMGGGMAPMHGAQGGAQGKEKRRDPRLAPDEDLYTEDRPWTEAVVGNRRRRDVHDGQGGKDA